VCGSTKLCRRASLPLWLANLCRRFPRPGVGSSLRNASAVFLLLFPYSAIINSRADIIYAVICGWRLAFPSLRGQLFFRFFSPCHSPLFLSRKKLSEGDDVVCTRQFRKKKKKKKRGKKNNWYLMRRLDQRRGSTLDRSHRVGHHLGNSFFFFFLFPYFSVFTQFGSA
jgi:hypothetical protein